MAKLGFRSPSADEVRDAEVAKRREGSECRFCAHTEEGSDFLSTPHPPQAVPLLPLEKAYRFCAQTEGIPYLICTPGSSTATRSPLPEGAFRLRTGRTNRSLCADGTWIGTQAARWTNITMICMGRLHIRRFSMCERYKTKNVCIFHKYKLTNRIFFGII